MFISFRMPPKRKQNAKMPLAEKVATKRNKSARGDQEQTVANMVRDPEKTVSDSVLLDRLADIMLDKMVAKGLLFAQPSVANTHNSFQIHDISMRSGIQSEQSTFTDRRCGMAALASGIVDQNVGQILLAPGATEQSGEVANSSGQLMDHLLNGTSVNKNMYISQYLKPFPAVDKLSNSKFVVSFDGIDRHFAYLFYLFIFFFCCFFFY